MEAISKPLRRLQEEGAWFARATDVRLLWVRADTAGRSTVLTMVERLEYHADNRSPLIALDDPWSGPDFGVRGRLQRFSERFAAKADALRQTGIELGPFAAAEPPLPGLEAFAARLALAAAALRTPLEGLVVVLAPVRIEAPEAFLADVHALVTARGLEAVRWIVVEADSEHLVPLLAELGERSLAVDARFDESAQQEDLAGIAGPPPPPSAPLEPHFPWGPWSSGGAMPAVAPPRRKDDSPAPSDEQLRANGLNPLYIKGGAQRLKQLMLGAALALRQQRFADAIELQARAADLCEELALHEPHAIQRLVLAGYLLAASDPAAARAAYERVLAVAHREKLTTQEVQAELGLGMLDALEGRPSALTHYTNAARVAEAAGTLPLAIECRRMAGQYASDQAAPELAVEHWQHALALADRLPPETQRATSAADIARLLAKRLDAYGEGARAAELQRHAFRIEHGVELKPSTPSTAYHSARSEASTYGVAGTRSQA